MNFATYETLMKDIGDEHHYHVVEILARAGGDLWIAQNRFVSLGEAVKEVRGLVERDIREDKRRPKDRYRVVEVSKKIVYLGGGGENYE